MVRRASPGAVAILCALEDAWARGVRSFDFLRGREAYKYAWGARDEANHRLTLRRA